MRYWLLTNTTYGTWLPGDPRGSITAVRDRRPGESSTTTRLEHDLPGEAFEPPIPGLVRSAQAASKGPAIFLTVEQAELVLAQFQETAMYRGWKLHAVAIMANHFHLVVAVVDDPEPAKMLIAFKAYGSRVLNHSFGKPASGTWWTTRGSKRKLSDDRAVTAAIHYVLHKQGNALVTWAPHSEAGEPRA